MRFRLLYEGAIAPRQKIGVDGVHAIRRELHPQLKALWGFEPLSTEANKLLQRPIKDDPSSSGILEPRGAVLFAPLVSKRIFLYCQLEITFLRQQSAGQLIGDGGDIDNRVKTLLDALSVPPHAQSAQIVHDPSQEEPVYCLLQDDSLVTKMAVETDRLLRPSVNPHDLVAVIHVEVRAHRLTWSNVGLAG